MRGTTTQARDPSALFLSSIGASEQRCWGGATSSSLYRDQPPMPIGVPPLS